MAIIVGVRFTQAGKIYNFDTAGLSLNLNDLVVVETNRGQELGKVVIAAKEIATEENAEPYKPIIRMATPEDVSQAEHQRGRARKHFPKARK